MCVYLRPKFEVSSIMQTSFRQVGRGGNFTPKNKLLKNPRSLGLKTIQKDSLRWIKKICNDLKPRTLRALPSRPFYVQ